jgi:hypothetical protein
MGVQEESFLTDPSQPEIDIWVKNVALEGMQNPRKRHAWTSILSTSRPPTAATL